MKVIIAGSRSLSRRELVEDAIRESGFNITEGVTGGARGVDTTAFDICMSRHIPVKVFLANWHDMSPPVKHRHAQGIGLYNALAGLKRNQQMADYADALIAVWDGKSKGTADMIKRAKKRGLKVFVKDLSV